jgi:glycogen phosphorylase
MLASDMLRAAADRELPMVAVTLLHRKGYFYQTLDGSGWQTEDSVEWIVEDFLRELPQRATVTLGGSTIQLRAWQYDVRGATGAMVPVYLLDTDLPENSDWYRTLTHWLYGGDAHYRLCQEVVLGIGGVNMLRENRKLGLQQARGTKSGFAEHEPVRDQIRHLGWSLPLVVRNSLSAPSQSSTSCPSVAPRARKRS